MKLNLKDIFSVKLYIEGIKKIRLIGIAAAITTVVLNAILPMIEIMDEGSLYRDKTIITYPQFIPFSLVMMLFTVLMVHSMFSYLNERKDSDFYHSIPQKRICVYLSFLAAILTWVLGILMASSLVNVVLWGCAATVVYPISAPFLSVLVMFLAAAMVGSFMALAMMLTGTNVANYLIFTLFFLFVRVVGGIFVSTLADILPIFDVSYSFWRVFEWKFFLPLASFSATIGGEVDLITAPLILYSIAVTVGLYALAGFCYVKRRSEMATKSAPNKVMQHVYRCAVTYPFLLILAMLGIMDGLDFTLLVIWVAIALLVYIIFELMTTKKIKNVVKALPLFLVPVAMTFVFTFAVYGTRDAVLDNTPDADEIESIGFYSDSYGTPSYNDLRIDEIMVEDENAKRIVADALEYACEAIEEGFYNRSDYYRGHETIRVNLEIKLKSGRTIGRRIRIKMTDLDTLEGYFMNSPAYRAASLALPEERSISSLDVEGVYLNGGDVERIWATFISEYNELSDKEKRTVLHNPYSYSTSPIAQLRVMGTHLHEAYEAVYPISVIYTPKTAQLYLEFLYDTPEYLEQTKRLEKLCREMVAGELGEYFNCSFNLSVLTGDGNKDVYIHIDSDNEYSMDAVLPAFEIFYKAMDRELPLSEGIPVNLNYWMDVNKGQTSSSAGYYYTSEYYDGSVCIVITEGELQTLTELHNTINN